MSVVPELVRAREAYERRDWVAAYDALASAATWPATTSTGSAPRPSCSGGRTTA